MDGVLLCFDNVPALEAASLEVRVAGAGIGGGGVEGGRRVATFHRLQFACVGLPGQRASQAGLEVKLLLARGCGSGGCVHVGSRKLEGSHWKTRMKYFDKSEVYRHRAGALSSAQQQRKWSVSQTVEANYFLE